MKLFLARLKKHAGRTLGELSVCCNLGVQLFEVLLIFWDMKCPTKYHEGLCDSAQHDIDAGRIREFIPH
jgi:hypothetical protein